MSEWKVSRCESRLRKLKVNRQRREKEDRSMPERFTVVPHGAKRSMTRTLTVRGSLECGADLPVVCMPKHRNRHSKMQKPRIARVQPVCEALEEEHVKEFSADPFVSVSAEEIDIESQNDLMCEIECSDVESACCASECGSEVESVMSTGCSEWEVVSESSDWEVVA
mmetsp:Transcript_16993/g.37403  ORF Transcript_16993/g.37403 Transcript_16993/m.37403 type:complete len:167 (-) Transcript_16993:151-651(-)